MPEPKCDFCSQRPVKWSYPARDFSRRLALASKSAVLQIGSRGDWACCQACYEIIQRGDRDELAKRSARLIPGFANLSRHIRRQAERELRHIHDDFWKSREGAPVPADDPSIRKD